jgi:hypothetical protein
VLPLLISPALIEVFPLASNCRVKSWQIAVGEVMSSTVTVALQVAEFRLASVTVKTTGFVPTLLQSKVFGVAT